MANGDPIGADLCSVIIDAATLPHRLSTDWTKFTFDSTTYIENGKNYAVVIGTDDIEVGEALEWAQDTAAGYANGLKCISSDSGNAWTQVSTRDCVFKTFYGGTQGDEYEISDAWQSDYDPYYIAQTFLASPSYTITSVDLMLRRSSAGETIGNVTISIRKIEGETYSAPSKPTNPTPINTGTNIDFSNLTLSWDDGGGADTYNVYVGDAADNLTLISSTQVGTSIVLSDAQRALFTDTCHWRIDATNGNGTTQGDAWWFTVAAPGKATTPAPTDDEEDIKITGKSQLEEFQWEAPV